MQKRLVHRRLRCRNCRDEKMIRLSLSRSAKSAAKLKGNNAAQAVSEKVKWQIKERVHFLDKNSYQLAQISNWLLAQTMLSARQLDRAGFDIIAQNVRPGPVTERTTACPWEAKNSLFCMGTMVPAKDPLT